MRLKRYQVEELRCGRGGRLGFVGEEGSAPCKMLQQWFWEEEPKLGCSQVRSCGLPALALGRGQLGRGGGCL